MFCKIPKLGLSWQYVFPEQLFEKFNPLQLQKAFKMVPSCSRSRNAMIGPIFNILLVLGMVPYFLAISRTNKGVDPFGSAVIHEAPKHFCVKLIEYLWGIIQHLKTLVDQLLRRWIPGAGYSVWEDDVGDEWPTVMWETGVLRLYAFKTPLFCICLQGSHQARKVTIKHLEYFKTSPAP